MDVHDICGVLEDAKVSSFSCICYIICLLIYTLHHVFGEDKKILPIVLTISFI